MWFFIVAFICGWLFAALIAGFFSRRALRQHEERMKQVQKEDEEFVKKIKKGIEDRHLI